MSDTVQGLVAILDALGAATYTKREADNFVEAREKIVDLVRGGLESTQGLVPEDLGIFTLNDSIVVVYKRGITLEDFNNFGHLLRQYIVLFMSSGILLRGSFAVGELFHLGQNTVMGPAVSDAADWYGSSDWVGVHSTPRTTMHIDHLLHHGGGHLNHVLIEYSVPMKQGAPLRARAVNWPKLAYLASQKDARQARGNVLTFLREQRIPKGTEAKYQRSLDFFDYVMTLPQSRDEKAADKDTSQARANVGPSDQK